MLRQNYSSGDVNHLTFRTSDDVLRGLERAQARVTKDMTAQQHVREIPHSFIFWRNKTQYTR